MSGDSPSGSVSPGIVPLASLQSWGAQMEADASLRAVSADAAEALAGCAQDASLASRVYLYRGDITELGCDAIVNAANNWMLGGAGVDGAIHDAAGPGLKAECKACPLVAPRTRCRDGDAVLTRGHALPAKYVIHTVGPKDGSAATLESCYRRCLALARERNMQSIAFPCIATGIYGYPNEDAAILALETVLKVLQEAQVAGAGGASGAGEGEGGLSSAGAGAAAAADAASAAADAAPTAACGGAAGTPAAAAAGEGAAIALSDTAERPPKVRRVGEEGGASSQGEAAGVEGASSEGADAGSGGGTSSGGGASSSSSSGGGAAAPFPPLSPRPPPSSAPWRPSVVFCVFLAKDYGIYQACLPHFFPYVAAPAP